MQDPFTGTWVLNVGRSEFDPNHRPQSGTMVVTLEADGYYLQTAEGVNEKGEGCKEKPMRYIPDGKAHPVPEFPGLTYTVSRLDALTMKGEAQREDGSVAGGATTTVTADGKSKTVVNFGYDSQLRQFQQKTVWDRR
jgi:hypothetical protein